MRARWLAGRGFRAVALPLAMAAVLIGPGPGVAPVSAAGLRAWAIPDSGAAGSLCRDCSGVQPWDGTGWQPQHFRINPLSNHQPSSYALSGVAAASPHDAWAVGSEGTDFNYNPEEHTWIGHWDGTGWTRQASPNPGACCMRVDVLSAVTATSPTSAWAVGDFEYTTPDGIFHVRPLIEHWDGTAWTRLPSPTPSAYCYLSAVAATSPASAWAIGSFDTSRDGSLRAKTLIEHWDGTAWTRLPSPNPGTSSNLSAVAATSPTNAWAAGLTYTGRGGILTNKTLTEHWDGTVWTRVPS